MATWLLLALFLQAPAEPARVSAARTSATPRLRESFKSSGVAYPPGEIFLRAFKQEREVELWAGPRGAQLHLVKRFPLCALSGVLGPKRRRGDLQVPEGVYRIDRFNPSSNFHLSLGLDYPNAADRISGRLAGEKDLGGDIFIHGGCATIGCLPLGDEAIEELYVVALDARAGGGKVASPYTCSHTGSTRSRSRSWGARCPSGCPSGGSSSSSTRPSSASSDRRG